MLDILLVNDISACLIAEAIVVQHLAMQSNISADKPCNMALELSA